MTTLDTLRMSEAELDLERLWTEAEYLAIDRGDTNNRIELIDGRLAVSPGPTWWHQEISWQLKGAIRQAAIRAKLRIAEGVNVRLTTGRLLIADLVVADVDLRHDGKVVDAHLVALVAEIGSPSNARFDRTRKMRFYEAARIGWYLLIEPSMPDRESSRLRLFHLEDGRYVLHSSAEFGETLIADGPFGIEIHTPDLLEP